MLFSLLFLTKTEQPSNCPPFEQSALYLSVSFSFGSKIVESLASEGLSKLKKNEELYGISKYQRKAIEKGGEIYLLTF